MRKITCLFILAIASNSAIAQSPERRCGWVFNPTPANWWIEDKDGAWYLSRQGDASLQSNGFMGLPDEAFQFGQEWVNLNDFNTYGHGCGCVEGHFAGSFAVLVEAMQPLPLARCELDPALSER